MECYYFHVGNLFSFVLSKTKNSFSSSIRGNEQGAAVCCPPSLIGQQTFEAIKHPATKIKIS